MYEKRNISLFKKADPAKLQMMLLSDPIISSVLNLNERDGPFVLVTLYSDFILIKFPNSEFSPLDSQMLVTEVDFNIKFDFILGEFINEDQQTKIGFKLARADSDEHSADTMFFYSKSSFIIENWIRNFRKLISEDRLKDKYKVMRYLGQGTFAKVYQVERRTDGKSFAVKGFCKQKLRQKDGYEGLLQQISVLKQLSHPNVVKIYGIYQSANSIYILMNLLTQTTLSSYLQAKNYVLPLTEIKHIMQGLLKGLTYLHDLGIAHRDLKPDNILLLNKEKIYPVITDFGLSVDCDKLPYLFQRCGTPGFIAPQIISSQRGQKISPQCDIFSLGCILYFLLTQRLLFEGKNRNEVIVANKKCEINYQYLYEKGVSPIMIQALKRMLCINPQERITARQCLQEGIFGQAKIKLPVRFSETVIGGNKIEIQMEQEE